MCVCTVRWRVYRLLSSPGGIKTTRVSRVALMSTNLRACGASAGRARGSKRADARPTYQPALDTTRWTLGCFVLPGTLCLTENSACWVEIHLIRPISRCLVWTVLFFAAVCFSYEDVSTAPGRRVRIIDSTREIQPREKSQAGTYFLSSFHWPQ